MKTCYVCGKPIRGECKIVLPTILMRQLFDASETYYHPACYDQAERDAEHELRRERTESR